MTEIKDNTQELQLLNLQLHKQNSFVQSFVRGLVTALGATVGLTVVLGLLILIISFVAQQLGYGDSLKPFLESLQR